MLTLSSEFETFLILVLKAECKLRFLKIPQAHMAFVRPYSLKCQHKIGTYPFTFYYLILF
jgi:hypothetical protein